MDESKVSIGLINPKNPINVGSVMRAGGNYRVEKVFYTGRRFSQAAKFNTELVNVGRKVGREIPLVEVNCLMESVPDGADIVCVEFAENAISLPQYQHPSNAFYIFGPEDGSISQELINRANAVVYVPTIGCMNLAATVNVLLYDRLAKAPQSFEDNVLIRQSRDNNNSLKVF